MFQNLVKREVEEELGPWEGTELQNGLADKRIAVGVKASLKNYEGNTNAHDYAGSFFKF